VLVCALAHEEREAPALHVGCEGAVFELGEQVVPHEGAVCYGAELVLGYCGAGLYEGFCVEGAQARKFGGWGQGEGDFEGGEELVELKLGFF
jgi:hypothetical protein